MYSESYCEMEIAREDPQGSRCIGPSSLHGQVISLEVGYLGNYDLWSFRPKFGLTAYLANTHFTD